MSHTSTNAFTAMTCGHCVSSVTEKVREGPDVENVDVVLEASALPILITSAEPTHRAAVQAVVEEAGYQHT